MYLFVVASPVPAAKSIPMGCRLLYPQTWRRGLRLWLFCFNNLGGHGLLRIAVVGCGWAARNLHLPALHRTGVGQIVAASDPLARARESLGAPKTFESWQEMLANVSCDAVLIASPPADHAEVAIAALKAGRHVLLEKPIATTLADGQRILEAAAESNRTIAVGFNYRCHPALLRLRSQIRAGQLGNIESIHVAWTTGGVLSTREWLGERRLGGGALMDLGCHIVDLWRFLMGGEIQSLEASSRSVIMDDETATLSAMLDGGAKGTAELSLMGGDKFEIHVTGSARKVTIHPYSPGMAKSYRNQWSAFAGAIRGDGRVAATLTDGYVALQAILSASQDLPIKPIEPYPPVEFPISAISCTRTDYNSIRTTIAHLRRQTIVNQLELILVGPTVESLETSGEDFSMFGAVQKVVLGPINAVGHGNASGVRRARGRVVAITEDHCFPDAGWAEAFVNAHKDDVYSVVGPVMRNANPDSYCGRVDFIIAYGTWMEPLEAQEMNVMPGHNSSYKRDELLALGGRLDRMMEMEPLMHFQWSAEGRRLRVEPMARCRHVNFSRWRSWFRVMYVAGRLFGGLRCVGWPRPKSLFYAAASPLIPFVRFYRVALLFTRPGQGLFKFLPLAPGIALGLSLDGLGQFMGYLFGVGSAVEQHGEFEFNRDKHVTSRDRRLWISR
ncbi:MAG: Gfo/Idh/MocA family oxidoreductase [Candidatus Sumerlaeaceae bacterium]|nr:Gfo/Idh/MocA family oxidoreductase [Candidatus Sumerlaeaceae bacterium]